MPDENPYRSPEQPANLQAVEGRRSPPSKVILAVAIANFIIATPALFCSGFAIYLVVALLSADAIWENKGQVLSGGAIFPIILLLFTMLACLFTGGMLAAGVGLLYRKPWGRILTLILASLFCLFGLLLATLGFLGTGNASPTERFFAISFGVASQLYPLMAFNALTQEKFAAEFVKTSPETTERPHE